MNILYITNHLNIGGITSYVLTLSKGMKRKGHNVYIASSGGELLSRFIAEGIIYIPIPIRTKQEVSLKILSSAMKLSRLIKQHNIGLLHSNSRTTQVLGCLLERRALPRHVSTCHGFFKKRFFRKLFPCWGRKVIAISASVKEHLIKDFKVDEKNIAVIYNGIDIHKRNTQYALRITEAKKKLGLGDGPVVGIVARLSDVKGHIYLIQAMKQVLKNIPDAQLLIVGDGNLRQKLANLTARLEMEKNVFFKPSVLDTQEVLSIMDLFVMPSLKEGLGLALMEAMAGGLAVIGSDIGGIRSLINDGANGLLVRPADVAGLTWAILELLQNPDRANSLGEAAQKFINENFSQEKMIRETEEVYLECVAAKE
mgnify:CR=1 FL=1